MSRKRKLSIQFRRAMRLPHSVRDWRLKCTLYRDQNGLCHWCGCELLLRKGGAKEKQMPENLATLDHLDDRFSIDRGSHGYGTLRKVLACWRCNNDRGRASQLSQPIEELRRRAGNGHGGEARA